MIKELHIYDFDATLFMSPMHPNDWEGHIGSWYDTLRSLSEPCVIDPPDDLWIESTVQDALASIADPNVYAVLMTGRSRRADLVARVMELIAMRGLSFNEVHLKPGGGTLPWKSSMIEDFASKMPDLQVVQIWEDRENHLQSFVRLIQSLGLEAVPHFVNVTLDTPCDLSGLDQDKVLTDESANEAMLRHYVREVLFEKVSDGITLDRVILKEEEGDKTSLAENGDCGVFAVALLKALADQGIRDAAIVIVADAEDFEGDYPISFNSFYDMDIFHICIDINGKYYDIRGERDIEEMLRNFVPYGGGGIEPENYIPADGRDYVGEAYGVPNDQAIDYMEKFVLSSTNVRTSVENYREEAVFLADKIASGMDA